MGTLKDKIWYMEGALYFNDLNEGGKPMFSKDAVKEAVLDFQNLLKRAIDDGCIEDYLQNVLDEHKRIFGDWK